MTGASGAISTYSTTAVVSTSVAITDQSIFKSARGTATASYTIDNSGVVTDNTGATLETWLYSGSASDFEVRATASYGTVTSGTIGSWLACSSDRTWTLSNSAVDNSTVTAVIFVEIRLASSGIVQTSATITISAESRESGGGGGGHL